MSAALIKPSILNYQQFYDLYHDLIYNFGNGPVRSIVSSEFYQKYVNFIHKFGRPAIYEDFLRSQLDRPYHDYLYNKGYIRSSDYEKIKDEWINGDWKDLNQKYTEIHPFGDYSDDDSDDSDNHRSEARLKNNDDDKSDYIFKYEQKFPKIEDRLKEKNIREFLEIMRNIYKREDHNVIERKINHFLTYIDHLKRIEEQLRSNQNEPALPGTVDANANASAIASKGKGHIKIFRHPLTHKIVMLL